MSDISSDWEKVPACRRHSSEIDAHVGTRMRTRREQLGMSHSDFARAVRISRRTLRSIETGTVRPMPATLFAISTTLAVPISYFFAGVEQSAGGK